MSLSCSCPEWEGEEGTWAYFVPNDFSIFTGKRRKRCGSCNNLIEIGSKCLKFNRIRNPITEIEEKICGEEISMPPLFMCEQCGEQYLNLDALGYCISPIDCVPDLLNEYHELTGFKKEKI